MKKYFIIGILLSLSMSLAYSQSFQGTYFLDGYHFTYRINPADTPSEDFRSGLLSSVSADTRSNLGLGDFLFPVGDKLASGLNSGVPAESFLSRLNESNSLTLRADVGLYSRGFRKGENYHSFEAGIRSTTAAAIPYDLFAYLKLGEGRGYDFSGTSLNSSNYLELAYGMSRRVGNTFSFGFRIKPLIGISRLAFNGLSSLEISGNQFRCSVSTANDGQSKAELGSIDFRIMYPAFAGVGLAADLGVQWKPSDYFEAGLSATDFGAIKWFDKLYAEGEDLLRGLTIKENKNSLARLPFNVTLSAQWTVPSLETLSLAFLGSYRNDPALQAWFEGRGFIIWNPLEWLSANVNVARNNYSWLGGVSLLFKTGGVNIFVGTDAWVFRITPQFIPAGKANLSASFGVSFPIAARG